MKQRILQLHRRHNKSQRPLHQRLAARTGPRSRGAREGHPPEVYGGVQAAHPRAGRRLIARATCPGPGSHGLSGSPGCGSSSTVAAWSSRQNAVVPGGTGCPLAVVSTGVDGERFRVDYVSTGIQKNLVIERQVLVGEKITVRTTSSAYSLIHCESSPGKWTSVPSPLLLSHRLGNVVPEPTSKSKQSMTSERAKLKPWSVPLRT